MRKIKQLLLCLLVTVLHLAGTVLPVQAKNPEGSGKSRIIDVVYDDSQSMVDDPGNSENPGIMLKRWSQARYAMEVFAAMMEESDEMLVFPMSLRGESNLTLKGKDSKRVESLHKWNSQYGGTPWDSITNAAEKLKAQAGSGFDERWLIILTDGAVRAGDGSGWNADIAGSVVQSTLEGYARDGIKVSYIAIGSKANVLQKKEDIGFYFTKTEDNADSVIAGVTETANKIFTRMELPAAYIKSSGTKKTLDIDIPTDRIIIFAQGKDAKVESLTYNGQQIKPDNIYPVKYSSDVTPGGYEAYKDKIARDTSLTGVVAEFIAKNQPFSACTPESKYEAVISGANDTNIKYYYTPGVRITFLIDGNQVDLNQETLEAGEYDLEMAFIDPVTGKIIKNSDLLEGAKFKMVIDVGGETQTIENGKGHIVIKDGEMDVEVSAVWEQYGNIRMEQKKHYTVHPEPIRLKVEAISNPGTWSPDYLVNNADPVIIRITNASGEALTDEQIKAMEIKMNCPTDTGISWSIDPGEEKGTWKLTPSSEDGTIAGIKPGSSTWNVHAEFHVGRQDGAGDLRDLFIKVAEYTASKLVITAEDQGTLKLMWPKQGSVNITVQYEDTSTGQMKTLTEDMWKRLRLKLETRKDGKNKDLAWKVELGDEVGTYKLRMKPHWLLRWPLNASGDLTLHMDGSVTEGEYRYSGTLDHPIHVVPMPWYIILFIILIALILLALGYLEFTKARIPNDYMFVGVQTCLLNGEPLVEKIVTIGTVDKTLWSVLDPFHPETAKLKIKGIQGWNRCPELTIEADKESKQKKRFIVINEDVSSIEAQIRSGNIIWPQIGKVVIEENDSYGLEDDSSKKKKTVDLKAHKYTYTNFSVGSRGVKDNNSYEQFAVVIGEVGFKKKGEVRRISGKGGRKGGIGFVLPWNKPGKTRQTQKKGPGSGAAGGGMTRADRKKKEAAKAGKTGGTTRGGAKKPTGNTRGSSKKPVGKTRSQKSGSAGKTGRR